jgi:hypothetical protein
MKLKSLTPQASRALAKKMSKYTVPFNVTKGYIDMRTMSQNFPSKVIPWQDINDLLDIVIGAPTVKRCSIDPTADPNYTVHLEWVPMALFGILSEIQRDMIPEHVYEIDIDFDGKKISVVLAMEDPVTGLICPFDGHHTLRVLDRQGWDRAPVAVLRAPKEMTEQDPVEARKYLMRIAGEAFLSINLTHKKGVRGYDQFIIKRDYGDPETIAVDNLLKAYGCRPVKIAKHQKELSHYNFLWKAWALQDSTFEKGRYLDLALKFHTESWPAEQVYGATLIGLAMLFQKCEKHKVKIDTEFFEDLKSALKNSYKLSKFTHEGYKLAYLKSNEYGSASDELIVTCGLVHSYNKHVGKIVLYTPELTFKVK